MTISLSSVPENPGVYLIKNKNGKIIYIGKAKSLKSRIQSHFGGSNDYKSSILSSKAKDIDYIITNSEVEALLLEANLIKLHLPKYNIRLKDDKKYPYIKITSEESFPQVFATRDLRDKEAIYFGPYTDVKSMKKALKYAKDIFPVRSCRGKLGSRVCLNHHMGRCLGPCEGKITKEKYRELIKGITSFLAGKTMEIETQLKSEMEYLSNKLQFEEAAKIRDRLKTLKTIISNQAVVFHSPVNMDVFGIDCMKCQASIALLIIREGRIIGVQHYILQTNLNYKGAETIRAFMLQYYKTASYIPPKILVPAVEEKENLENWLKSSILLPKSQELQRLMKSAQQNASFWLKTERSERTTNSIIELQQFLKLKKLPIKIEAFDISNLGDKYAVGSCVSFYNGKRKTSGYRKFRIKSVLGVNDVGMIKEIISRRVKHKNLPDLILVDGGTGQTQVARELVPENIPVFGLAKKFEQLYTPDGKIISLPKGSASLSLLQRIRDEAHRFAISYHKKLRGKKLLEN